MTGGAGDGLMSALERKPGRVMIEFPNLAPCNLAVAILAFFTKASLMRINGLVTVEAASRRLAEFYGWRMTAGARHRSVRVPKQKIRQIMIECLAIELDDVGVSSLVIGVTMVAFGFCGVGLVAMKSLSGHPVRCNLLVTRKA